MLKNLLSKDLTLEKEDAPQILIYHTHSQESYKNSKKDENVVAVGQKLTDLLTEKGWNVYHDTTVYDLAVGKLDRSVRTLMHWKELMRSWPGTHRSR